MNKQRRALAASLVLLSLSLSLSGCGEPDAAGPDAALSFNWDVRPIISDNCFACHGPDAEGGQKAGLRLDLFETATAELPESPGKFAIVPGAADASELIRRISSSDPDVVMPPPDSNKTLTPAEKQTLANWIDQGAAYERHWAYVPVQRPALPEGTAPATNPVDAWIGARLQQEGLAPAAAADPHTLINRVTLDLTGLPPTLEEVDAFVADTSPGAYEALVDRLLASTAHAEHMTAQWLDVARWADTDGYLEDAGSRLLHPWRDWVLSAYQRNLPFDDFLGWQLAGDLLPQPTQEQILATTFLRLGQRSSENGIIAEEYANEYAVDRVETLGVGILGHTLGCARCHDHKYDPVSINDFYSFAAFFSDTREPGFYTPGGTLPAAGFVGIESGATLKLPDAAAAAELAELESHMQQAAQDYVAVREQTAQRLAQEIPETAALVPDEISTELAAMLDAALAAHYPFESLQTGDLDFARVAIFGRQQQGQPQSVSYNLPAGIREELVQLSPGTVPGQVPALLQSPLLSNGYLGKAFLFDEQNKGYFGGDVGDYDRTDAFSLDFRIRFAQIYEVATVLNHNQHIRFASNGYALDVENNHLRFDLVHSPDNKLSVRATTAIAPGEWRHVTVTYDGSSRAAGIKLYLDAQPLELEVLADNLDQSIVTEPLAFIDDTLYGLAFGKRWQQYTLAGSALDEVKVYARDLSPLEIAWLHDAGQLAVTPEAYREFRLGTDAAVLAAKAALRTVAAEHNQRVSWLPEIMVMGDDPHAAPMQVKKRGVYSDPGVEVEARALGQIFAWDESLPANRLGLIQWLFDPQNPLTARVQVNRLWQSVFGRGIVETAEDFGTQGAIPSHPQLLDWLAAEYMAQDWDTRHLLKLLVLSDTYRQESRIDALKQERDPYNLLLSRGVRLRHNAETIRDTALSVSGLLDASVGGASVHPYQPEGVWKAVSVNQTVDYPLPADVPLNEHHRRTLYSYVKRAAQHPALQVFDFPQRITTVARRRSSNTPLQALVLLNDPQYLEAYEGMAWRALQQGDTAAERITHLYQLALRREPVAAELAVLTQHYQQALQRYAEDTPRARDYLGAGLAEFDVTADDLAPFAALASTARIVMNSPDAYTRH